MAVVDKDVKSPAQQGGNATTVEPQKVDPRFQIRRLPRYLDPARHGSRDFPNQF